MHTKGNLNKQDKQEKKMKPKAKKRPTAAQRRKAQARAKAIHQYIRRGPNRKPRGVLIGMEEDGIVKIGWSLTNVNSGDQFDKLDGMTRAFQRVDTPEAAPPSIQEDLVEFENRCCSYFKGAQAVVLPTVKEQEKA
jgi:hypothetical protein